MKTASKIRFIISLFFIVVIAFIFSSCIQIQKYPPEPEIAFEGYSFKDTINGFGDPAQILILTFSFMDGDGDIGLEAIDTLPPKPNCKDSTCNNLYINRIGIKNGVSQVLPVNYRIPVITPEGQNKTLKGEIAVRLEEFLISGFDTVICEIYLVDRALNQSNIIKTPEIVLNN